jgi:hypothetical protein
MSTNFVLSRSVSARDLFEHLEKFGIREHLTPDTTEKSRCLTDGRNYLWVYITEDRLVGGLSRYGMNAPGKILDAIAETFETEIFSEYEPQYWGFDTQEEWDAWEKERHDQSQQAFYVDLCAHLRGEPSEIKPGTVRETMAKIAKKLVEEDATVLDDKDRLLAEIKAIYDRDHAAVIIKFGPEDLAFVRMVGTHEDDLPQA